MVLKKQIAKYAFLLFINSYMYAQEYAFSVIEQIIRDSPEGKILSNNADSMKIAFLQQKKYWLPSVQLDMSASSNLAQGDFDVIRNSGKISGPQLFLSPEAGIGISQNLPGNGKLTLSTGYAMSYLPSQNVYRQQPYLQTGLTQTLGCGAFFLTRDPSIELLKNKKGFARVEYEEALFELVSRFINTVQDYNLSIHEKEYNSLVLKKIQAEYDEISNRYDLGQESTVELFELHMKQAETVQNYQKACLTEMQSKSILEEYRRKDIVYNSDIFRDEILLLLNKDYGEANMQTMQEQRLLNEIKEENLSLKINEEKFFPQLYMQMALSPDQNKNSLYADLSRSLRDISEVSSAWAVNASIGIHVPLDYSFQMKLLKNASLNKTENLELQLEVLRNEQEKLRSLYNDWTVSFSEYCTCMSEALQKEELFRKDLKTLFETNVITEAEYWSSEVSYFETRLNYYRSIWNMVQGKLNILRLSSVWEKFIHQFIGEDVWVF